MSGPDATLLVLRLVVVVAGLFLVGAGIRAVLTRRLPRLPARFGHPGSARPQPVRIGGAVALIGAALLLQQAAFLLPVPRPARIALGLLAFPVLVAGLVWLAHRRD